MKLDDFNFHSIGDTIQLVGGVYGGEGRLFLCLFPEDREDAEKLGQIEVVDMDPEDWKRFMRQTDILETEVLTKASDGTLAKAILRKSQRQIDQVVAWNVFRRDKYTCRYCGRDDVPLTVDHLVRWEEGGPTIEDNLLSACRKCNRTRGKMSYDAWMRSDEYKRVSKNLDWTTNRENHEVEDRLPQIPRMVHIKSR